MILDLNDEEAQQLAQLIDLAVRAQGLNVAGTAVLFMQKLKAAAEQAAQPQPDLAEPAA